MNSDMQIKGFLRGEDPLSTMRALNQMGAEIEILDDALIQIKKKSESFHEPSSPKTDAWYGGGPWHESNFLRRLISI